MDYYIVDLNDRIWHYSHQVYTTDIGNLVVYYTYAGSLNDPGNVYNQYLEEQKPPLIEPTIDNSVHLTYKDYNIDYQRFL